MKIRTMCVVIGACALLYKGYAQPEFTPDSVKNMCKRVARGRLKANLYNGWQVGTYFEGIMALYSLTNDKQYLDSAVAWGTYNKWLSAYNNPTATPKQDTFPVSFDDVCCYQAYLETYLADPSPANLPHIQAALSYIRYYTYDTCPNTCAAAAWPIIDQYHMAAPIYPRAAVVLNDPVIYDSVYHFSVENATRHYNVKMHLFNSNCSDTNVTRQWWGRGCGWGVCGTCRLHQYLPPDHPGRAWCEQKIRETCAELLTLQNQSDGMWRSELFTPAWNKEASGSGFFCYEFFYALRNGIIDTATYLVPAKKAWKGLIGCVGVDPANPDLPGWSQGVGGGPSNNFGPTNHDEYTEGAFLMAGDQFYKFLVNGIAGTVPAASKLGKTPALEIRCAIGRGHSLDIPATATGVECYTLTGRRIFALYNLTPARRRLFASQAAMQNGVMIVKFLYEK
ncbi:MAG TPA: glycoside hydrolase family 88 protein [Chitinivibrionales bacterium]|nr:glycoside hydrolase family 88 protein [Chitinivibrionales bacterium]